MTDKTVTTIKTTNRWDDLATIAVPRGHKEWPWFLAECERVLRKTYEDGFSAGVEAALRGVNEQTTGCRYEKA